MRKENRLTVEQIEKMSGADLKKYIRNSYVSDLFEVFRLIVLGNDFAKREHLARYHGGEGDAEELLQWHNTAYLTSQSRIESVIED